MSGVRLSRSLLPYMLERGWGRIIFVSSESGLNIPTEMVHYGMTKTAQVAISRGIAESVAGTGVTVNAVLPGPTRSEGAIEFLGRVARERGMDVKEAEAEVIRTLRPDFIVETHGDAGGGRQPCRISLRRTRKRHYRLGTPG